MVRKLVASSCLLSIFLAGCGSTPLPSLNPPPTPPTPVVPTTSSAVIKHVVVIFGENISFDHYFGTYPNALNLPGETKFTAATGTPIPNNCCIEPRSADLESKSERFRTEPVRRTHAACRRSRL